MCEREREREREFPLLIDPGFHALSNFYTRERRVREKDGKRKEWKRQIGK